MGSIVGRLVGPPRRSAPAGSHMAQRSAFLCSSWHSSLLANDVLGLLKFDLAPPATLPANDCCCCFPSAPCTYLLVTGPGLMSSTFKFNLGPDGPKERPGQADPWSGEHRIEGTRVMVYPHVSYDPGRCCG